jgi:hypothetical protein
VESVDIRAHLQKKIYNVFETSGYRNVQCRETGVVLTIDVRTCLQQVSDARSQTSFDRTQKLFIF